MPDLHTTYNTKVTFYHNEIQISRYGYKLTRTNIKPKKESEKGENNKTTALSDKQSAFDNQKPAQDNDKANQVRSTRRSKQSIYAISRANRWDYFATFTFESNRYDYDSCKERMRNFLRNFKARKAPDLEWLVVPEQHKDGAWHMHALLQGSLDAYLTQTWRSKRYALMGYNLGKCELEKVEDTGRVSSYITKYITKELADTMKNKRRYFYSKGLNKGEEKLLLVDKEISTADFILGNFPDYYMSHAKATEYNGNRIDYIQLKHE